MVMPNNDIRNVLHPIAEQIQRQSEQIRRRAEWIDAVRRRLWERMDRLRAWQGEHPLSPPADAADAEKPAVHLPGLHLARPHAPAADPE